MAWWLMLAICIEPVGGKKICTFRLAINFISEVITFGENLWLGGKLNTSLSHFFHFFTYTHEGALNYHKFGNFWSLIFKSRIDF